MQKRQMTSFLKDGDDSSGSIKSTELLYQMGTGFARSLFNSVRSLQKTYIHTRLLYRQWRRNRPLISICYSLRNGQYLFILADKHGAMETLSLSLRSPSRCNCRAMNMTVLAADIPHRSASCQHFAVVDVHFNVALGRMHWQITTDRHVTSSQSLTFPNAQSLHRALQDRETKAKPTAVTKASIHAHK
jgi:hypothetical protein